MWGGGKGREIIEAATLISCPDADYPLSFSED